MAKDTNSGIAEDNDRVQCKITSNELKNSAEVIKKVKLSKSSESSEPSDSSNSDDESEELIMKGKLPAFRGTKFFTTRSDLQPDSALKNKIESKDCELDDVMPDTNEPKKSDKNDSNKLQTILLSATLTPAVEKLAGLALTDPVFIDGSDQDAKTVQSNNFKSAVQQALTEELSIPASVIQSYILVPPKLRLVVLSGIITTECSKKNGAKVLVFMATQDLIDFHLELMRDILTMSSADLDDEDEEDIIQALVNVEFFKLHGSMSQQDRTKVFKEFRQAKAGVLLCTDVAARGIDVPEVDLVLQYTAPQSSADYVHRVGRTARAGKSGKAVLFLAPNESPYVRELESRRIRLTQEPLEPYLLDLNRRLREKVPLEAAATELQKTYEASVQNNPAMYQKACKAFSSFVRFYTTFPRDTRAIFNIKTTHTGHIAKSLALMDIPVKLAKLHDPVKPNHPVNRLTVERTGERRHKPKPGSAGPMSSTKSMNHYKRHHTLVTSEYESGLPPLKKKKKL